jgi:DNA-directed RNA polymerase subunit RPC12/RpoP
MNINYCSNCGYKVEQNGVKLNFCPKCGQSLNTLKKTVASVPDQEDDEVHGGEIDISSLKDKIKISVDMDIPKPITVGDVINASKGSAPEEIKGRPAAKLPKGKELLKVIAQECSSSRGRASEIDE